MTQVPRLDRWRLAVSILVIVGLVSMIWFTVWVATDRADEARAKANASSAYDRCIESIPLIKAFNDYTQKIERKTGVVAPVWPLPDVAKCKERSERERHRG